MGGQNRRRDRSRRGGYVRSLHPDSGMGRKPRDTDQRQKASRLRSTGDTPCWSGHGNRATGSEIDFPMEARRAYMPEPFSGYDGLVALRRGPIVYTFEGIDNFGTVCNLLLPVKAPFEKRKKRHPRRYRTDRRATGRVLDWDGEVDQPKDYGHPVRSLLQPRNFGALCLDRRRARTGPKSPSTT